MTEPTTGEAWSRADSEAALAEGWDVWDAEGVLEIQRDDDPERGARAFGSDAAARDWVMRRAAAGSDLHARAYRLHGTRAR